MTNLITILLAVAVALLAFLCCTLATPSVARATIALRNPKAFAPAPLPSAPGVEPVVVPQRIVSADKKAIQAGGLCVALDGVPVRPSDAVDVNKKYQLIPIPTE